MNMKYSEWCKLADPADSMYRPVKADYIKVEGDAVATQKLYDLEDAWYAASNEHSSLTNFPEF